MKASLLKGKTIARVVQVYHHAGNSRAGVWAIEAIEFTDGSCLRFVVAERETDYAVEGVYPARRIIAKEEGAT